MLGPSIIAFGVPYSVLFAGAAVVLRPKLKQSWGLLGAATFGVIAAALVLG